MYRNFMLRAPATMESGEMIMLAGIMAGIAWALETAVLQELLDTAVMA